MRMERRYERLRPADMRALIAETPIAWHPIGTLEWQGEHLPLGVDAFEAHGICLRAAELAGGVVLPPTYLASGVLALDYSLSFDLDLVCRAVSATVEQLADVGFRVVVVLTGHGPLDLNHGLKRIARELEARRDGLSVYGLCWLELNAARMTEPQRGEPEVVDHAALVETSYMLALEPELVALEQLPDDPTARPLGVYGRNPRFTASREWGERSLDAAVALLAERAAGLLRGEGFDVYEDLRRFVDYCWPEALELTGHAGAPGSAALLLTNPGGASRFITSLAVEIDGATVPPDGIVLANENVGEGRRIAASALSPESGFYIRREQTALAQLPLEVRPGARRVYIRIGLGGVREAVIDAVVRFDHERAA